MAEQRKHTKWIISFYEYNYAEIIGCDQQHIQFYYMQSTLLNIPQEMSLENPVEGV